MKNILSSIIRFLSRSGVVYLFSRKVVDYHDSLNNCEFDSNGELSFLERNIGKFSTLFDVGANVGGWSQIVNDMKPEAAIFAFEPVKSTFDKLANRKFNQNVHLENIALGASSGEAEFFIHGMSELNSLYNRADAGHAPHATEKIKLDTLDGYCSSKGIENIDLLKIDVEGQEFAVLQGAERLLSQKRIKAVQFEYGGSYINARVLLKDVFELFMKYGYALYKIYPDRLLACPAYRQELDNFQYSNFVAVAPGVEIN